MTFLFFVLKYHSVWENPIPIQSMVDRMCGKVKIQNDFFEKMTNSDNLFEQIRRPDAVHKTQARQASTRKS